MIKVGRVLFAAGRGAMGCGLSLAALILAAPGLAHAQTAAEKSSEALPPITVEAAQPSKAKKKKAYKAPASAPAAAEAETATFDPSNESTVKGPLGKGADVTITSKDLDRTQPQTIQNLYSSQTAVTAGGTTQASTKVYVHGIEETMLNVQIDGARQAQRNGFHHNGNNVIDPSMLKGVAIDAGAASADAGPNALGGAIRYTTKDVSDLLKDGQKLGGFAALSYDTNSSTFKKTGSAYGKSNGFEILGYASGSEGNSYEDGHENTVSATDVDLVNYLGKLAYESPEGHRFAVSGEHVSDEGLRPFRTNLSVLHPGFAPVTGGPLSFTNAKAELFVALRLGQIRETVSVIGVRPPSAPASNTGAPQRIRVGGLVQAASLIHKVDPLYPADLQAQNIQGHIELDAVISKEGNVINVHERSLGQHPGLVQAATDAVRQWRYKPTLLNGEPVEVLTTVTVRFLLN